MSAPRYLWRQLNEKQRADIRGIHRRTGPISGICVFSSRRRVLSIVITLATAGRMDNFSRDLLAVFATHTGQTFAWCVLPNHYHALVETPDVKALLRELGLLHGRTAHAWNGDEQARGRKVFFRAVERAMRSDRHYRATLNYVHHNPVRHGYVARWTDWPWSSATEYLAQTGVEEAKGIWQEYPLHDYGKDWDEPGM
jgi:putative transposase